jgi:thiol-disulfide isomerase/thioredoxin
MICALSFVSTFLHILIPPVLLAQQVTVRGNMAGHYNYRLEFRHWDVYQFRHQVLSTVTTDDKGNFEAEFPLEREMPVELVYNNGLSMKIWLRPGSIITLSILEPINATYDGQLQKKNRGMTIFHGDNAALNNFLFNANISVPDPDQFQKGRSMSPDQYSSFLDSMERARLELRMASLKDPISSKAEEFIFGEVVSNSYGYKSMYSVIRSRLGAKNDSMSLNAHDVNINWANWKFLSDSALISTGYQAGLQAYFNARAEAITGNVTNDMGRQKYFATAFRIANIELERFPATREYVTAFYLYHSLLFVERCDSAVVLASHFKSTFRNSRYFPAIEKKLLTKKNTGKRAPLIAAYDSSGHLVNLQDLRGKVVYVDVWASYCKPCIEEFPKVLKLSARFRNHNVQFVYLNLHDSKTKWINLIRKYKLAGINLRAEGELAKKIRSDYGIDFIPRYLLIDANGDLLSFSAKKPGDVQEDIIKALEHNRK